MIPAEVLTDPELSGRDIRVYAFISLSGRNGYANVGGRRIAEFVHANRDDVGSSIAKLVDRKHVEVHRAGTGSRLRFKLLSEWFARAGHATSEPEATPVVVHPKAKDLLSCPRCSNRCRGLLKVGWCRHCQWGDNVDRRIDAKLKTA